MGSMSPIGGIMTTSFLLAVSARVGRHECTRNTRVNPNKQSPEEWDAHGPLQAEAGTLSRCSGKRAYAGRGQAGLSLRKGVAALCSHLRSSHEDETGEGA